MQQELTNPPKLVAPSNDTLLATGDAWIAMLQSSTSSDYPSDDFSGPTRQRFLMQEVTARIGSHADEDCRMPGRFVVEQAAERHYALVTYALKSMRSMFTEGDIVKILNTTCGPVWEWHPQTSVATMVADDNGVESLDELEAGSPLRTLLAKLTELSALENGALVDVCERVWRGTNDVPLSQFLAQAGLHLAAEG